MKTISESVFAIGASVELLVLVKATAALALGLLAVRIARSSRASVRHLLLAATFGVLFALPLAAALVPAVLFEIPTTPVTSSAATPAILNNERVQRARTTGVSNTTSATSGNSISISREMVFRSAWTVGATLFFAPFGIALWRLRRAKRCGVPWLEARAMLCALTQEAGIRRPV